MALYHVEYIPLFNLDSPYSKSPPESAYPINIAESGGQGDRLGAYLAQRCTQLAIEFAREEGSGATLAARCVSVSVVNQNGVVATFEVDEIS